MFSSSANNTDIQMYIAYSFFLSNIFLFSVLKQRWRSKCLVSKYDRTSTGTTKHRVFKSNLQDSPILLCAFPEQQSKFNFQFSKHCCFHFLIFLMLKKLLIFLAPYSQLWRPANPLIKSVRLYKTPHCYCFHLVVSAKPVILNSVK